MKIMVFVTRCKNLIRRRSIGKFGRNFIAKDYEKMMVGREVKFSRSVDVSFGRVQKRHGSFC